jgi:hypothetical protein
MAELNAKQIEQIAKIRKESKKNRCTIAADGIGTSFVLGAGIGLAAGKIIDSINDDKFRKITDVESDTTLSSEEKAKKIKKIKRVNTAKGIAVAVGTIGLDAFIGWNKGGASAVAIKHEDELMKKRIAAVIATGNKTTTKK